jgi:hypothetical protein
MARVWRPVVARECVARAKEGSRGGEQGQGRERTTRGGRSSKRWSGSGGRAAARGEALPRQQEGRAEHVPEEEEEREGVQGGLFENFRNLRDLSVN